MHFFLNYGLFLAKVITIMISAIAVPLIIISLTLRKRAQNGILSLTQINDDFIQKKQDLQLAKIAPHAQKIWLKNHKKLKKQQYKIEKKEIKNCAFFNGLKPTLYVIDFRGSIDANEVSSLREEISAILSVKQDGDQVFLRLESRGGVIHGYGLAAAQLQRLRDSGIFITASVDKIAASGGYMMACVANCIIAAPFAIVGSIGVIAQLPNFHRLLKNNNIDVELHTAGKYKRTLTFFGENTKEGREKFQEDLDVTHLLFKKFVHKMRPIISDIDNISTGECWYGSQALELSLIDKIGTSDDFIINNIDKFNILSVRYIYRRKILDHITDSISLIINKVLYKK